MILGWRLCRAPFADFSGEGARRFGGRWNSPGRALVYFADHPALALLEVRVHLDLPLDLLPDDYRLIQAALPEAGGAALAALPADPRRHGDAWLDSAAGATLCVPSVILPEARNILLNPRHPQASAARLLSQRPFRFDPRLFAGP